ncbi:9281_t:CDS:2 [Gigaspora margarita]|uniref:9281_t:CDS:1 n=1 Tax=Gigaspora margarita TaxID=4874 RepID=A0ABN7UIZ2_GIGMA|nr:9281_t:CDS:2 [Gigaspora margarita]
MPKYKVVAIVIEAVDVKVSSIEKERSFELEIVDTTTLVQMNQKCIVATVSTVEHSSFGFQYSCNRFQPGELIAN